MHLAFSFCPNHTFMTSSSLLSSPAQRTRTFCDAQLSPNLSRNINIAASPSNCNLLLRINIGFFYYISSEAECTFWPDNRWFDFDGAVRLHRPKPIIDDQVASLGGIQFLQIGWHMSIVIGERDDFIFDPGAIHGHLSQCGLQFTAISANRARHRVLVLCLISEYKFQSVIAAICDVLNANARFNIDSPATRNNGHENVRITSQRV